MDISIKEHLFIVGGASSGLGKAISESLATEGAKIIVVARGEEKLTELFERYPGQVEIAACDITQPSSIDVITRLVAGRQLHGILVNAGGPPAKSVLETTMQDWDNAYSTLLRWKVDLLQQLVPGMIERGYGRIVFIESASVKQPIENLVLSNSLRLAVVGFAKTLSQEISRFGVTVNVLAPSYHKTAALDRIFQKKHELTGASRQQIDQEFISQTSVGFLGLTDDFASLATWLLSPHSRYLTGQTISVDGGVIKGIMG